LKVIDQAYRELGGRILGLIPDRLPQESAEGVSITADLMRILIDLRAQARESRDWETADKIRDRLSDIGIALEDRPEGTTWRLI
jgi:cysteinyl-tRNA synthetase